MSPSITGSVLDLKKSNQIKSNQIQNIQRFDLDLKSFLTQWFDLDLPWFSLKIQIKPNQIKKKKSLATFS